MYVLIEPDAEAVTARAYEYVRNVITSTPHCVLGLPTGSTPLRLYQALVKGYDKGELSFAKVHTFNLDEYIGLGPDHPQSYRHFMEEHFFRHVNMAPDNVHFLSGLPEDIQAHCEEYEQEIRAVGGITLQILGIGRDGHIGFNEPTSSLRSRTRDKTLTRETIEDNRRFFDREEDVPRWALTMGVGTILETREVLVLATGHAKASAVAAMVEGPVTAMCTASALQNHPRVHVVCDDGAAAKLNYDEYYRWMAANDYRMHSVLSESRKKPGSDTGPNGGS